MGRPPCCDKVGVKKGPWTPEEDIVLVSHIQQHGPGNWRSVPIRTGLSRCSKSCRLRWTNYLRPGIKRGKFTPHEEGLIIHLQALLGNKWVAIASHLPQRTDNDVKNYWNTHLKKKLERIQSFHTSENQFTPSPSNSSASKLDSNSVYAWSSQNVFRLLENWVVTAPAKENDIKVKQEGNGDLMSKEELETILSFENLNEVPWERSSCDSDEKGLEKMVDGDIAEIAFDRKNQGSLDHALPSSFIEKWIVDDATFDANKMLELSSISQ